MHTIASVVRKRPGARVEIFLVIFSISKTFLVFCETFLVFCETCFGFLCSIVVFCETFLVFCETFSVFCETCFGFLRNIVVFYGRFLAVNKTFLKTYNGFVILLDLGFALYHCSAERVLAYIRIKLLNVYT